MHGHISRCLLLLVAVVQATPQGQTPRQISLVRSDLKDFLACTEAVAAGSRYKAEDGTTVVYPKAGRSFDGFSAQEVSGITQCMALFADRLSVAACASTGPVIPSGSEASLDSDEELVDPTDGAREYDETLVDYLADQGATSVVYEDYIGIWPGLHGNNGNGTFVRRLPREFDSDYEEDQEEEVEDQDDGDQRNGVSMPGGVAGGMGLRNLAAGEGSSRG